MFDHLRKQRKRRQRRVELEAEAIWQEMQRIHSLAAAIQGYPAYDPEVHRLR